MRMAIAAVAGIVLAALACVGGVQIVSSSQNDPVNKPLYNYGSR
ncbi:MAG: hypothetical protein JWO67_278 [Streptosporangiaceae bacterium]|jgi:hypothetical protein|nr:hypothetical protein [Streptosporangiaceae bacterium]